MVMAAWTALATTLDPMGAAHVNRILITGVRGKTGAPLAQRLAGRDGVEVLGGSSDPSTVRIDGVRSTALSWDDPSGWPAATDGVDAVYVVRPDRPDAPELVAGLVAGTPAHAHVVLLSGQEADASPPDAWALRVEDAVRGSGREWTVLRPGWFMQVFTDARFFRDQIAAGELPFSSGGARVAWIDTRDIAAVADSVLLEPGHAGRTHKLSGPEAVTLPQTAQLLSRALGRPVAHVELTVDEAVTGMEGFDRDLSTKTFERLHAGVYAEVTDTVERVTGRRARTLQTFLADSWPTTASAGGAPVPG
jgi:uncharacterized protein YbjT (DUF2867 family)